MVAKRPFCLCEHTNFNLIVSIKGLSINVSANEDEVNTDSHLQYISRATLTAPPYSTASNHLDTRKYAYNYNLEPYFLNIAADFIAPPSTPP